MAHQDPTTLRLVVAAAGYGKTTALRRILPESSTTWRRTGSIKELIDGGLAELARQSRQLILDDVPRLSKQDEQLFLAAVAGIADTVSVTISSRWPVDLTAVPGLARFSRTQLRPNDLHLSTNAVAALLSTEYGLPEPDLPARVFAVTAGWPALVRMVAECLSRDGVPTGSLLAAMTEPGDLVASYVVDEVLDPLEPQARLLLSDVAELAPVTAGLCTAVGHPEASKKLGMLVRTGLLVSLGAEPDLGPRLVPIVAAVARHSYPARPSTTITQAAEWYRRQGPPRAAALTFQLAGDASRCAQVLAEHGEAMAVSGRPTQVAELIDALPRTLWTRQLRLLAADARRIAGQVAAAAHAYELIAAAEPVWDAGIAWRMGLIAYLRGDQTAALAAFARAEGDSSSKDRALLLAWTAAATARSGDAAAGTTHALRAYQLAVESGHDSTLATAHISLALCLGLTGDQIGSEEHYELALGIAERSQDLVLLARILTNQSYHLVAQARFTQALTVVARAVRCADLAGHANLLALAIGNEAEVLTRLGRYDEAVERYQAVLTRYRQMGSRTAAAALVGLGDTYRLRGWREQAQTAYGEGVRLAGEGDSRELTVKALAGLALVLLGDDIEAAAGYADQAALLATDELRVPAVLAQGWVALARGDREGALRQAGEAVRHARMASQRAGVAEALELRASAEIDTDRAREALREANAIWVDAGAIVNAARALTLLSRLPGATVEDRLAALLAAQRLVEDNVPADLSGAVGSAVPAATHGPGVVLRALGRFEVHVLGSPVPAAAWQSRRARDLLRVLVARRGRPMPRAELSELLWPDDDTVKTRHRLSVLLSIVRGILDPDKLFPADHYLVADAAGVGLDITHLRVDVLEFMSTVAHGRRLLDRGAHAEARAVLQAALADYSADVFEDEPYDDWAQALREQARAAYLQALRMLADSHRAARATAAAVDCLLRLLEKDRYDEAAHRALVRTLVAGQQHGEARRAFARYCEAMAEIGVRPPDEGILAPVVPASGVRRPASGA